MGCNHNCVFYHRSQQLIILLLFLLISSFTHDRFIAEGRSLSKLIEAEQMGRKEKMMMARNMLGSRPPRCDRRCSSCGHCVAVQVPVSPLLKSQLLAISRHFYATPKTLADSRGVDISNYKPMCWKCKCGDFIVNP